MIETSPNALILVNKQSKITYLNHFAEKLFKYKKSELLDTEVTLLIPKNKRKKYAKRIKFYFNETRSHRMGNNLEFYALKKDDTIFPIEIGLSMIPTAKGPLIMAVIIDISKRRRAEERFRLVVESAPNAIILVNDTGYISLVNRQTELLFGYSREELIGNTLDVLIPQHIKKEHPDLIRLFFNNPHSRSMSERSNLYARHRDGTKIPVEIGLNPIQTEKGKMVLASIINITEKKDAEEARKLYTTKLELKNKELEQYSYIASHDLQEPLNTVINFIELLSLDLADKLDNKTKKSLQFITEASYRMKELIVGLLAYSRLGQNPNAKLIDTNLLVESVLNDLHSAINKANACVTLSNLPTLIGYETELRLLFQNLISNAVKFRKSDTAPEISISATKENRIWNFTIKDNGIGIAPQNKDKVFIIFQRLHSNKQYKGTGIGLAHCRKIVELHNGKISVESELGQGSTFHFSINSYFQLNKMNEK
jgi:PAS domain S-box-containing protein